MSVVSSTSSLLGETEEEGRGRPTKKDGPISRRVGVPTVKRGVRGGEGGGWNWNVLKWNSTLTVEGVVKLLPS